MGWAQNPSCSPLLHGGPVTGVLTNTIPLWPCSLGSELLQSLPARGLSPPPAAHGFLSVVSSWELGTTEHAEAPCS